MNLLTLLDMVASGFDERIAIGRKSSGMTYGSLRAAALCGGSLIQESGARTVIYIGENGPAFPVALFGASAAGVPFLPLNYRLTREHIQTAIRNSDSPYVITDDAGLADGCDPVAIISVAEFLQLATSGEGPSAVTEPSAEDIAVLLQTSGTTSAPKSVVIRHKHLVAYVLGSVDFGSAEDDDAMIVSVPPYHIAAVANLLSNLYSGRRIVYLDSFTARGWLEVVEDESVTHAMVVPTMLSRIVDELEGADRRAPSSVRSISYGGARIAPSVLARALELFPESGFVNAYGLTETSSSVAVFGPDDHRAAIASSDPQVRARLGSVGKVLPGVALMIRGDDGTACPANEAGQIWVRGEQVSGEYLETGQVLDDSGWFNTRDRGWLDNEDFLFIEGRTDDTIIRGGENIAPAEIEDVIDQHPGVLEVAVAGIADDEWGQRIAAFVVIRPGHEVTEIEIQDFVRQRLRSSKTPDLVELRTDPLPQSETGKILRRSLVAELETRSS